MEIKNVIQLLGGLALFLYGMQMMSNGLEDAAGNKMKVILEKVTSNRFLGVLVGAVITALIQSSSATTVMVVGFVNAKMMNLRQAVWIIMGANIGTTVTGLMISMDVGEYAPLFAFIGVFLIVFLKNAKLRNYGNIIAGLGVLFIGMEMMGVAMYPLREYQPFLDLMTKFSNPFYGILAGAIFTAIIQSSSASVGILQTLAASGLISLHGSVFVLFGQNIGTCITAILAAIGSSNEAKRTTIIHLSFNVIGTVIFTLICLNFPLVDLIINLTGPNVSRQIANTHTMFNIVTTLLLLPFGNYLADFAEKVLPQKAVEDHNEFEFAHLTNYSLDDTVGHSAILSNQVLMEVKRMFNVATGCLDLTRHYLQSKSEIVYDKLKNDGRLVDYLDEAISEFITSSLAIESNNLTYVANISKYYNVLSDITRIKDHCLNIAKYSQTLQKHERTFSDSSLNEMNILFAKLNDMLQLINDDSFKNNLDKIKTNESEVYKMCKEFKFNHIERMKTMKMSNEASMFYSQALLDFNRIGNHLLNISEKFIIEK